MGEMKGFVFDFLSGRYVRSSDFSRSSSRYHFLKDQYETFYDHGDIFKYLNCLLLKD